MANQPTKKTEVFLSLGSNINPGWAVRKQAGRNSPNELDANVTKMLDQIEN